MKKKHSKNKSGFSLIEVMVAALLLAVLAIGGAAVLSHAGSNIQVIGNKQIALERARTKLEWLHNFDYQVLRATAVAGAPSVVSTNETHNGVTFTIITTNRLVSTGGILDVFSGGTSDNEYIELSARATYRNAAEAVLLHAIKTIEP
ncbi:MAG: prepilin-type N-terminal cleavage/methylation domain-containing protein [Pontiella sp.]